MKFWRKSFSLLLALVIMLGAVPAYAFEEDKISSNEEYALSYHDVDFQPNNERAEDVDEISANKATSVPSKYSSVTSGNTAAVKNQNPYGTCWACSATAVCESSLITYAKDNGDENPDKTSLSVLQLVNYFYNSNRYDPLGNLNGDGTQNLIDTKLDEGGNNLFTMWGLASWVNGAPEAALPYQSPYLSQVNNNTVDTKYANDYDIAHLQNAYILPYSTDKNSQAQKDIKQAIIDYGAVACSYYHNDSYINSSNGAYYTTSTGTNHAVTIVGWNDDYPSSNFNKKPSGNGAWLVKNSWGSSWSNSTDGDAEAAHSGRQGYFWLSYYDASINSSGNVFAYLFEPIDNYKNNYQYDGSCGLQSTYVYDAAAIYQIKGLTSDYETIDAVGIGFNDTNVSGKIYIYLDPVNNNPKSGTLLTTQNFSVTFNGFHTIKIDDAPIVEKGHNISIVVIPSKTTTVYYDCTYQNSNWISFTANTTNDKTYKYTSSSSYTDFKSTGTLRIKAYTNDYISGERFTITYDGNGATSNVPDVLTKIEGKDCTISSQIPVKTGYTFMGWGNDASNPTKVYQPGDTYSDDASITLYAIWQIQTYTLKYNANGGSGAPAEQTKEYGKALTLSSTVPTRTGYVFKGWGTSASSTTASYQPGGTYTDNKAVTLYAVWQAETYTISYDANGGSGAPNSQTKTYGKNLTLSRTKPVRTGFTFKGWGTSASSTTVVYQAGATYSDNASITLYAVWQAETYTLKYNANGGSGTPAEQTKEYGKALTLSSTVPTRTGYVFKGWGTSASSTTASYQPGGTYTDNKAVTLYAVWQAETYTISYDANGGSGAPANQTKTYGKNLTLSATKPVKAGCIFKGWGTSASSTTASYQPGGTYTDNKAVTLYAVWQAETYTISYDANGGSGAPAGQTKKHGETLTLSTTKPTRAGYDFVGWATTSTSSTVAYQPGASYTQDADLKLYAVWKEQASVSVKDNGNYVIDAGDYKGTVTFLVVQRNDSGQILPGMTLQTFDLSQQSVIDGMLSSGKYELYLLDSSFAPLINVVNANVK